MRNKKVKNNDLEIKNMLAELKSFLERNVIRKKKTKNKVKNEEVEVQYWSKI